MPFAAAGPVRAFLEERRPFITRLMRFGLVGVAATLVHGGVLAALVEIAGIHPTLGNIGAYLTAFLVSYMGHFYVTFRSRETHLRAAPRYFLVACTGLAANTVIFFLVVNILKLHYTLAFVAAIATTPWLVYFLSHRFAYAPDTDKPAPQLQAVLRDYGHFAPALVFFAIAAVYGLMFHYAAPLTDHWHLVTLYMQMEKGVLSFQELFRLHGAHFHASAYAVLLPLAKLTGMNHGAEVIASLLFSVAGFAGLALMLSRGAKELNTPTALRFWAFALAAFFWWSLDQSTNWLWGWQVAVFINTAGAAWCILLLSAPALTWMRLAGAWIAATLALLGFATGAALFPVGAGLLVLRVFAADRPARRRALVFTGAWCALSALALGYFLYANYRGGDTYASETAGIELSIGYLWQTLVFTLNFLASPLTRFASDIAIPVLFLGIAALAMLLRRRGISRRMLSLYAPFFAFMAYGVGAGLLTALGRSGAFGTDQAFVGRYISFGNFFWIGLLCLMLLLLRPAHMRASRRYAAAGFFALTVVLKIGNSINVANDFIENYPARRQAAATLREAWPRIDEDALAHYAAPQQNVKARLDFLAENRLSLFAGKSEAP